MSDPVADLARLEGVPSAVASARAAVDAVLRDRGLRRVGASEAAAALVAGARASAELTGDPERWLPGAVRLSTELLGLSALITSAPGQVLARAHALVAYGQVPDDALGRVRSKAEVAERVQALANLLTRPTTASAVLVAALAHAEIATAAPFGTPADRIIARAVEHMVLVASGVDPQGVIVVEAGHLALRSSYERALVGYREGTVVGVRAWLLHGVAALATGADASPLTQHRARA